MSSLQGTRPITVALVGNPNTGKTTIFNYLTGTHQRIGNYPGITVEKKTGVTRIGDREVTIVDLPGTYSMAAASADERVVVDTLAGNMPDADIPDAVVCVVDSTNLDRNLFLVSQVADLGLPMVVALNLSDSATKQQITINESLLADRLGVPVIPTIAPKGDGLELLKAAILDALDQSHVANNLEWPEPLKTAAAELARTVKADCGEELTHVESLRILFDANSAILDRLEWDSKTADQLLTTLREDLRAAGMHPQAIETMQRYRFIETLTKDVVTQPENRTIGLSEKIDKVLTHRFWGLVIFAAMMYVVFQSVYSWAGPLMNLVESTKASLQSWVGGFLTATPHLRSLVCDGIIEGIGSVLVFLPQIIILFLFIAVLEDTGYMARAAVFMDRLFSRVGLNGRSFVPLLSSFACAVPGILSARTVEDPRARLTTILIAPLMSCSARLPVYVLMIGAFVEPIYGPWIAGLSLFTMYFVGPIVAIPTALLINRFLFKTTHQPLVIEMPPYRLPQFRDVGWRIWERASQFLVQAGTIIFAITIIVWALLYFPRPPEVATETTRNFIAAHPQTETQTETDDENRSTEMENAIASAYMEQSLMGRMGKTVQPIFAPAGFDWKITVGVLASFPAREVIIATLGIIYQLGGDVDEESGSLRGAMAAEVWPDGPHAGQPVFTLPVVAAIMVFFALCMQCGATLAVMARESHWKWAVFAFFYMTFVAWLAAVAVYQIGTRLT